MTVLGAARATAVWLLHSVLLAVAGPLVPTLIWLSLASLIRWEAPPAGALAAWWLPAAGWSLVVLPVYAAHRALAAIELTGDGTPPRLERIRRLSIATLDHGISDLDHSPTWYEAPGVVGRPVVVDALAHRYAVLPLEPPDGTFGGAAPAIDLSPSVSAARELRSGAAATVPALVATAWWLQGWLDVGRWLTDAWRPRVNVAISTRCYLAPLAVLLPFVGIAIALAYAATLTSVYLVGPARARALAAACGTDSGVPRKRHVLADGTDHRTGFAKKDSFAPLVLRSVPRPPPRDAATWRQGALGLPFGVCAALAPWSSWWQFWVVGLAGFGSMVAVFASAKSGGTGGMTLGDVAVVLVFTVLLPLLLALLYPRLAVRRDSHRHEDREQLLIADAGPQDDVEPVRARFDRAAGPRISRLTRLVGLWPLWVTMPVASFISAAIIGRVVEFFVDRSAGQQTTTWVAFCAIAGSTAYLLSVVFVPRKTGGMTETLIRSHAKE